MRNLTERGLVEPLTRQVLDARTPVLGICLGAQLMATEGREFGVNAGLGWIDAVVERIAPPDRSLRIPHVGWNAIRQIREDPLLIDIPDDALFYFVHSFAVPVTDLTVATADYGICLAAIVRRGNFWGTQFHPERSARTGARVLANFLRLS